MRIPLALLTPFLLALLPGSGARAEEEVEDPLASPIPTLLAAEDPELDRIYRGISKGLEQCAFPRTRPEVLGEETEEVLARLEEEGPKLLFVVGARAARRLGSRLASTPRVFVDTAWDVNGQPVPPGPEAAPPAAVVRGVRSAAWVARALREGFGERPWGVLSWRADTPALQEAATRLADAAGYRRWDETSPAPPQVLLHLRLGLGEAETGLDDLLAESGRLSVPLLSDDIAHWTRGAAILVLPDLHLLGRVAAEMGRQLLESEPPRVLRRDVRLVQIWVDLRAARGSGLELPVPFLAGVDRLRGAPPRRPAPEAR